MRIFILLSAVLFAGTMQSVAPTAETVPAATQTAATCTRTVNWVTDGGFRVPLSASGGGNWDCTMGSGSQSEAVWTLQATLNFCHGFTLNLDGIYGPNTAAAVRAVQELGDVTIDGIYGPQTRNVTRWRMFRPNEADPASCVTFDA